MTLAAVVSSRAQAPVAQQPQKPQPPPATGTRKASTVTIDKRTGRLVRTVVVAPKVQDSKPVAAVAAATPSSADPSIDQMVEDAARTHGVDPLLVHSVIKVESNYNPKAVSNKGAQGLMQLMPGTARDLGVKHPMDPKENIEGGVKYLKYLQSQFADPALALAAYNAGEGAVRRYNWIPPYPETQDYVVKVARNYRQAQAAAAASATSSGTAKRNTVAKAATPAKPEPAAAVVADPPPPPEPPPAPVVSYYDSQGRLTLRTLK